MPTSRRRETRASCGQGVALLTALLLLAGCASAGPPRNDPFVGTWRATGGLELVIARDVGGYAVTMVTTSGTNTLPTQRYGNELKALSVVLSGPNGRSIAQSFEFEPHTGRLAFRTSTMTFEFSRVSDSTTIPSSL